MCEAEREGRHLRLYVKRRVHLKLLIYDSLLQL